MKPMGKQIKRKGWLLVTPSGWTGSQWYKTKKYALEIAAVTDDKNDPEWMTKPVKCEITFTMPVRKAKK